MESNNNHEMVTSIALKEDDIELELGLSLGGNYQKPNSNESRSDSTVDTSSREKQPTSVRSSVSPYFVKDSGMENMDPKTKREIHALRRQEAKRKREEKQLKKGGSCKGYFNGGQVINGDNVNDNNGVFVKAKASQSKEREPETEEHERKKTKTEDIGSTKKVSLNLNTDQNNTTSYAMASTSSPVLTTVLPVQYSHPPPLQYGPPTNGFVYPCANVNVMPCWFTAGEERNVVQVQPVVSYGFVPFQPASDSGHNVGSGYDSEQNGSGREDVKIKGGSNGSAMCASSTGSDHRSFSNEGGGSSDTRSRSSPSLQEQPQLNKSNIFKGQSDHSVTSELIEAAQFENKSIQSSSSTEPKEEEETKQKTETTTPLMGKPPKPQTQQNQNSTSLPYMPCVSTTGNGPNGKTINGFLYRYTKTEVSIICVCHGSSFSPAEFVQHAGGTDISHPLKHITVIPSAF